MSSKTIPIPKTYLEKILKPVNRLTESCVLKVKGSNFYTICTSEDNSVILYVGVPLPLEIEEELRLNIISAKKLLSGLTCLGSEGEFKLKISDNNIVCQMEDNNQRTHFKYHLVDDHIIKECPLKVEKFESLDFDTSFTITSDRVKQILNASTFATEASKVYFSIEDGILSASVDDKTLQNIDNMTIPLTNNWKGDTDFECFPISLEIFRNLAATKNDIKVNVNNEFKIIIFQAEEDDNVKLKYIVSALIK